MTEKGWKDMNKIKRAISLLLALTLAACCAGTAFAVDRTEDAVLTGTYLTEELSDAPDIQAGAAVLMDVTTGTVLYEKNADEQLYPASITKIMTALLVLENCELDDIVTFSDNAVYGTEAGSSTAGIDAGALLTVEETLYAMLLVSANEAATALAEHVSGSVEEFAALMTQRAQELGCTGTQFTNANGLPDEEHYTTAHGMALILEEALHYETFRTISGSKTYTIADRDTLYTEIELWNHFKMIYSTHEYYYEYAEGGKTGYTTAANATLASFAAKDGVELLCIILNDTGSGNHYKDTEALYEWGFEQVDYATPLEDYDITADLGAEELSLYKTLDCAYGSGYTLLVSAGAEDLTVSFEEEADRTGGVFGYLVVQDGDTEAGRVSVTFDTSTAAAQSYLYPEAEDETEWDGASSEAALEASDEQDGGIGKYLLVLAVVVVLLLALLLIRLGVTRRRRRSRGYRGRRRTGGYNGRRRRR